MNKELKNIIDRAVSQVSQNPDEADALMAEAFKMTATPEEKREAGAYLTRAISNRKRPDVDVKGVLGDLSEVLNLSYIAKRYFNKNRTWLYQRINKSIVNGKPAAFTDAELKKLSDSLNEISNKIHQTSVQFTH